jgi:hypothetical protein
VDAGVHHLQGKAEGVTPTELQQLIRDFYMERVALLQRHEASARFVADYDVNNAYQYVIAREETHVSWLLHALHDLGAALPTEPAPPAMHASAKGKDVLRQLAGEDARGNGAFVAKWAPIVDTVANARHRNMLKVILGEMLEHERIFGQSAEGRVDVIGIPMAGTTREGGVAPTRWIE